MRTQARQQTAFEQPTAYPVSPDFDDPTSVRTDVVTEFHVTGFNRFFNVEVNPTQLIVQALSAYVSDNPFKSSASLSSSTVLEVSASSTREELEAMYHKLAKPFQRVTPSTHARETRVVFVHLGVNMRSTCFQLEMQAKNEATFSCPDEAGWTPIRVPIDSLNSDITAISRTSLDIPSLVSELSQQGFNVQSSTDAGRFVCNWVYYNSLKLATYAGAHALFVHVPPASCVPIEEQVRFIATLLDSIASDPSIQPQF